MDKYIVHSVSFATQLVITLNACTAIFMFLTCITFVMALKSLFYKSLSKDLVFYYIQLRLAVWKEKRIVYSMCVHALSVCMCAVATVNSLQCVCFLSILTLLLHWTESRCWSKLTCDESLLQIIRKRPIISAKYFCTRLFVPIPTLIYGFHCHTWSASSHSHSQTLPVLI